MFKKICCFVLAAVMMCAMVFGLVGCDRTGGKMEMKDVDDKTIFVVISEDFLEKEFALRDFRKVKATHFLWVNEISFAYYKEKVYAVKVKKTQDVNDAVTKLKNLNFVEYAWANHYDYNSLPEPRDEKQIWGGAIDDSFEGTTICVDIDRSFSRRVFTVEDFGLENVVAISGISWYFFDKYNGEIPDSTEMGLFSTGCSLKINKPGKQSAIDTIRELEKLNFVMAVMPDYIEQVIDD